jgi:hypothetical protein
MNIIKHTTFKRQFINLQKFNFSKRSHVSQIQKRDQDIYEKVMNNNDFSTSEFTNFLRIVNKRNDYSNTVFDKITNNISVHINNMDESDIRKLCDALDNQKDVSQDIVSKLKEKTKKLRNERHVDEEYFYYSRPETNWSKIPLAYRFWIHVHIIKDSLFAKLSLK